jgi:hypothetical protein
MTLRLGSFTGLYNSAAKRNIEHNKIVIFDCLHFCNKGKTHRLNMELDLQSLFGLQVHSCAHWLRLLNPPPAPHLGSYTRALLVRTKIDDISL